MPLSKSGQCGRQEVVDNLIDLQLRVCLHRPGQLVSVQQARESLDDAHERLLGAEQGLAADARRVREHELLA
eukprot:CAMPEP_0198603746 /NCGR_PEP_ID=MMETSP1462-20131121/152358_1 /TAXON_ID=1333877 /ORGANISM="Brandtodinium nutriculum, Strain RCC3387" /LENGTH=71 /DNA_ID=CAMNT_0044335525 /DNA_START=76 /DNA_END=287 /DNA_ORIENTATION=+